MNYPIKTKGLLILSILLLFSTGCSYQSSEEAFEACEKWAKKGGNYTSKSIYHVKEGFSYTLREGERWVKPSKNLHSKRLFIKEFSVPVRICVSNSSFEGELYGDQLWFGGYKNKIGKKGKTVTVDIRKFARIVGSSIYWNKKDSESKYVELLSKNKISETDFGSFKSIVKTEFEKYFQLEKKFRY